MINFNSETLVALPFFMICAGPDDYTSDPAGNASPRIACGITTSVT